MSVYLTMDEAEIIRRASKIISLGIAPYLRSLAIKESRKILEEFGKNDTN